MRSNYQYDLLFQSEPCQWLDSDPSFVVTVDQILCKEFGDSIFRNIIPTNATAKITKIFISNHNTSKPPGNSCTGEGIEAHQTVKTHHSPSNILSLTLTESEKGIILKTSIVVSSGQADI